MVYVCSHDSRMFGGAELLTKEARSPRKDNMMLRHGADGVRGRLKQMVTAESPELDSSAASPESPTRFSGSKFKAREGIGNCILANVSLST